MRCAHCGAALLYVRPRSAGGSNAIELAVHLDEYLCRHCVDRRKHGHTWEQLDLFGGQP